MICLDDSVSIFGGSYLAGLSFWRLLFLGLGNYSNITVFTLPTPRPALLSMFSTGLPVVLAETQFLFSLQLSMSLSLTFLSRKVLQLFYLALFFLVPHIFNFKFFPIFWFLFLAWTTLTVLLSLRILWDFFEVFFFLHFVSCIYTF